jgi:hypothetical protein
MRILNGGQFTPRTVKSDHRRWPFFHGPTWWSNFHGSDFLKHWFTKPLGALTGCKPNVDQEERPCTKKWMCWFCYLESLKNALLKKQFKFDHCLVFSWVSLVFTFCLNVLQMWLANFLTTKLPKKISDFICTCSMSITCDMYLVLYIEHYLQPASSCVLEFSSSRCPTFFGETCGGRFKG